jgi:hypothetical protein
MRSPGGASAAILRRIRQEQAALLLSVPLAVEYEAICQTADHSSAAGLTVAAATIFRAIIAMAEPLETQFLGQPQLRVCPNGGADSPVTFNLRDYGNVPSRFGVELLLPRDAIKRIRR